MSSKKVRVQLARLVRETKTVVVEVFGEDEDDINARIENLDLSEVYDEDDDMDWEADIGWGPEEGSHETQGPVKEPSDMVVTLDGVVSSV